jgi:hypothetical protein
MCSAFRLNETGVYKRGEMFVYFAQLIESPKDKLYFVLLEAHAGLFLKMPVCRCYL